jgi:hypothetical protein
MADAGQRPTLTGTPTDLARAVESSSPPSGAARSLRRLEVFLDVLYALIVFRMLAYLPSTEDMTWVGKPLGLLGPLIQHRRELWKPVMGIGLTVICWSLNNKRLSQLHQTDGVHTVINLVQMAFVCLFIYFAIGDPMLAGGSLSRALQGASLALAGVTGQWAWAHARRYGLVDAQAPEKQLENVGRNGRAETVTAVLTMPLAWIGTITWTLGWFIIPLVITQILPRLARASRAPS